MTLGGETKSAWSRAKRARRLGLPGMYLVGLLLLLLEGGPRAVEIPPAAEPFYIQTNGPNAPIGDGDWYTASAAQGGGAGHHYLTITIPCGWPSGTPVHVDLFSPAMHAGSVLSDEQSGSPDTTQFELYAAGSPIGPGFGSPAPGGAGSLVQTNFAPSAGPQSWVRFHTLAAPVACGTYVLRSSVIGDGNDQNGWRLRVGLDDDADPTTAPPGNTDNPDGLTGTNDEIVVGLVQVTFQHDAGSTICLTLFEYVPPGQTSTTFHNFDFDATGEVMYYAPSQAIDTTPPLTGGTAGTVSGATVWNGGTTTTRGGNVVSTTESGWWRIVSCIGNHNQFIQEAQLGVPIYYSQPPTPALAAAKSNGLTQVSPGQVFTYTTTVTNSNTGSSPGAANDVVITDTLPSNVTFQSCALVAPASGTCSHAAGVVTGNLTGVINAGSSVQMNITVRVNDSASGTVTNSVSVSYEDALANSYPAATAADSDAVEETEIVLSKDDGETSVIAGDGATHTYTITVSNAGPSDAVGVTVSDDFPAGFTRGALPAGCTDSDPTPGNDDFTCSEGDIIGGGGATISVTYTVPASSLPGPRINSVSLTSIHPGDTLLGNTAFDTTSLDLANEITITKTDGQTSVIAGDGVTHTYTITVSNAGPSDAFAVTISDDFPAGFTRGALPAGCTDSDPNPGNDDFTCSFATIAAAGSATVTIDYTVPSATGAGVKTNSVSVTSTHPGDDPAGNSAIDDTTVVEETEITITKTDGQTSVIAGDGVTHTYTITVSNAGPSDAVGVTISDTFPTGFTRGALPAGCTDSNPGNDDFTCDLGTIVSGDSATVTIDYTVPSATTAGVKTNSVSVTSTHPADDPAGNSASDSTDVITEADLSIVKLDDPDPVLAGELLTYTVTVTNLGPSDAHDLVMTDTLGPETTFDSMSAGCAQSGSDITCTTALLVSGDSIGWTITVVVDKVGPDVSDGTIIDNEVEVTSATTDSDPSNNQITESTTVTAPDLVLVKTAVPPSGSDVSAGEVITFVIDYSNEGTAAATNFVITDFVDPIFGNVTPDSTGTFDVVTRIITWTFPSIGSGESGSVSFTARVGAATSPQTITNLASGLADELAEPISSNETSHRLQPADVLVIKSADRPENSEIKAFDVVTYEIRIRNRGTGRALGVVVTDDPPPHMSYVSGSTKLDGTPVGDSGGTSALFGPGITLGTLDRGDEVLITFQMTVAPSAPAGALIENWAYADWNLGTQRTGDFSDLRILRPRTAPTLRQTILVQGPTGRTIFVTVINELIELLPITGYQTVLLGLLSLAALGFGRAATLKIPPDMFRRRR